MKSPVFMCSTHGTLAEKSVTLLEGEIEYSSNSQAYSHVFGSDEQLCKRGFLLSAMDTQRRIALARAMTHTAFTTLLKADKKKTEATWKVVAPLMGIHVMLDSISDVPMLGGVYDYS